MIANKKYDPIFHRCERSKAIQRQEVESRLRLLYCFIAYATRNDLS